MEGRTVALRLSGRQTAPKVTHGGGLPLDRNNPSVHWSSRGES